MTTRLDAELAARGLARSRSHASQLIASGVVSVDGRPVVKPSTPVAVDSDISVAGTDHYVSRAAHKLIAGLDAFPVEVDGRTALDLGASTGGFTQVLRERGARPVMAVDVGHGQLSTVLSTDPDVVSVEGYNVRFMTADSLAAATGVVERPRVVTDPALRSDAVHGVLWAAWDAGLRTAGLIASPLVGTHGNQEYVAWFSAVRGGDPSEWESTVTELTGSR